LRLPLSEPWIPTELSSVLAGSPEFVATPAIAVRGVPLASNTVGSAFADVEGVPDGMSIRMAPTLTLEAVVAAGKTGK
jgi:hypothetical protein